MSNQRDRADKRFLTGLIAIAGVVLLSLRSSTVLLLLIELVLAMGLPALFIGMGTAIAGAGNRLIWLCSTFALAGLSWPLLGSLRVDGPSSVWLDFVALSWFILCPIASLISAWLLAKYHPAST